MAQFPYLAYWDPQTAVWSGRASLNHRFKIWGSGNAFGGLCFFQAHSEDSALSPLVR